jgi:tetratricopeptide (TPR) repeat protein
MMHLTEDDILVWLVTEGALPPDMERHSRGCEECSAKLREGLQFRETLRDPATWTEPRVRSHRSMIEELEALERRLDDERSSAEALLRVLEPTELEFRLAFPATLGQPRSDATVGLVRALIDRSFEEVERDPKRGLSYASLAVRAALLLRPDDYPLDLVLATRGQAWRQRANARRMSGELVTALEDLDRAAAEFNETAVPEPEIATLHYIRATVYWTQGRLADATKLLHQASRTFRRFGDDVRFRNAQMLLAGVIERSGDRDEAIEILRGILKHLPAGDAVFRGRVLHNLGVFLLHGNEPRAESYLQQAHHCLQAAGLRTEALRALWNLGRAARQRENFDSAARTLEKAYEEAAALGLHLDVAMIALDRAELYLAQEEIPFVQSLCQDALRTFQTADTPRFAAEAFAYLEAAAKRRKLSTDDLSFVRDFFVTATAEPGLRFVPPAS